MGVTFTTLEHATVTAKYAYVQSMSDMMAPILRIA